VLVHVRSLDTVSSNCPARLLLGVLAFLILSGLLQGSFAQSPINGSTAVFYPGERLQYKVSWLLFRLGTIVVTTEKLPNRSSRDEYRVVVRVDSNPALFFVSVHSEYESILTTSPVRPSAFIARELRGSDTVVTRYVMNEALRQVHMSQWRDPGRINIKEEILDSVDAFYEGSSLFFLARSLVHSGRTVSVPTLVEFEFFKTDITFTNVVSAVSIDAKDEDLETKELYGFAHFVESSLAGLSGEFRGWFSNDEAAIPLQAELNLSLGTADIELEQWLRGSWSPPLLRENK